MTSLGDACRRLVADIDARWRVQESSRVVSSVSLARRRLVRAIESSPEDYERAKRLYEAARLESIQ